MRAWRPGRPVFPGRAAECIRGPRLRAQLRLSACAAGVFAFCLYIVATTTPLAYAKTSHVYESAISDVPVTARSTAARSTTSNSLTVHAGDLYIAEQLDGLNYPGEGGARTDQFAPSTSKSDEYEFVSQLPPQLEPGHRRYGGIVFGSTAGETEIYIGRTRNPPPASTCLAQVCAAIWNVRTCKRSGWAWERRAHLDTQGYHYRSFGCLR